MPSPAATPQTAAEWVAGQDKPPGDPYQVESAGTRFKVALVGPDGVVLDHGHGMAVYPVPPGLELQVGDKVEIGRGLALRLPIAPEQGQGDKGPGL